MKYVLLILLGAALLGGGWYLYSQNVIDTENEEPQSETVADEEATMDEHETAETVGVGGDAGMEFPTVETDTNVSVDTNAVTFDLRGSNYTYDREEIRVKEGDTVVINFTSADGFHDFVIDEFGARTARVSTGGSTSVTFVADKKGTFEYYCSVGNHRAQGMVGMLIVE